MTIEELRTRVLLRALARVDTQMRDFDSEAKFLTAEFLEYCIFGTGTWGTKADAKAQKA